MKIIKNSGILAEIGEEHFFPTTKSALKHALKHDHRIHHEIEDVPEEELAKFNLTKIDLEEKEIITPTTEDKDPVEEMLESLGVMKVKIATTKGFNHASKFTKYGIDGVTNVTKKGIGKAVEVTKDGINGVANVTKKGFKGVKNINPISGVKKIIKPSRKKKNFSKRKK